MRFANTLGKRHKKTTNKKNNYQSDRKIYKC